MFNCLEIHSTTRSMLRCKDCKSILFGQDQITEFMAYDPQDFGKLKGYANHKKFQEEANFFLLTQTYEMYSSFKIDYSKSLRLDYHPFFMMHMLLIECQKCKNHLGYQVETVNQNTLWMEGRMLIDASKCSVMKEGKDEMLKLIKVCRSRLVKKLESVNSQQKKPQNDRKNKYYEKLEKIKLPNQKVHKLPNNNTLESNKDKVSQDLKKRGVSVQSTRGQTSFLYKDEKQSMSNYTLNDMIFKTDQTSYGIRQSAQRTLHPNNMTESMVSISMQKFYKNTKQIDTQNEQLIDMENYIPIQLTHQKRQKLNLSLQLWRQKTINESKTLKVHPIIQSIEEHIWKLDAYENHLMSRVIEQQMKMEKLFTNVRENVLEEKKTQKV